MPEADQFDQTWQGRDPTPGRRTNNWYAEEDPTVNDDEVSEPPYEVGSRWVVTATQKVWTCVDPTEGAAVWVEGAGTSSHSGLLDLDNDDHGQYALMLSQAATPPDPPLRPEALWYDTDDVPSGTGPAGPVGPIGPVGPRGPVGPPGDDLLGFAHRADMTAHPPGVRVYLYSTFK